MNGKRCSGPVRKGSKRASLLKLNREIISELQLLFFPWLRRPQGTFLVNRKRCSGHVPRGGMCVSILNLTAKIDEIGCHDFKERVNGRARDVREQHMCLAIKLE